MTDTDTAVTTPGTDQPSGDITDYARMETRPFDLLPFNEVDALILAQLMYESMPECVPRLSDTVARYGSLRGRLRRFAPRHPLRSARALVRPPFESSTLRMVSAALPHDRFDYDSGFAGVSAPDQTEELFRTLAVNPRFADVAIGAYVDDTDVERQTQFAAATFLLPDADGTMVLTFRGTDGSLVGWKEDFNMAFRYPIPAQQSAAEYATRVAGLWRNAPLVLEGHSKGGNAAVYAAMNVSDAIRERIARIYSLDGPGFPGFVVESPEYAAVIGKVRKIIPESSIVGMIFETPEPCTVVKSDATGIMQHLAFSWRIRDGRFIRVPGIDSTSRYFSQSLGDWLSRLPNERRERVIDSIFTVLQASGATSMMDLPTAIPKALPDMFGAWADLPREDRDHIAEAFRALVAAVVAHLGK